MRSLLVFLLTAPLCAQSSRYRHGDDPRWADPRFGDSGWPTVPAGATPLPTYESSGILWIRDRVPAPQGEAPLAILLTREGAEVPSEVWGNGVRAGGHGRFPPNPQVPMHHATGVFDLPPGLLMPGELAVAAWRGWAPPDYAAVILGVLNNGLAGQMRGGFATCCCARFDPDGMVTIANAGHPSPYCDGREVEIAVGLPLRVLRDVAYEASVVQGERFTFVSDGVVEAENPRRELFGFERTRVVSTKPAREIADAAQAWGQNDDITVVTVRRRA